MSNNRVIKVNFSHASMADDAVRKFSQNILETINTAVRGGVAQGIIVAMLQGYLHNETRRMLDASCDPDDDD